MRNSQQHNGQFTPAAPQQTTEDSRARKQCFAIVAKLKPSFESHGISESAIWSWSLGSRGLDVIGSRSQFSQHDWAYLAARLQAAQRDQVLFSALCDTIKTQGECRVYRIEAGTQHKQVFTGVFDVQVLMRCQNHADATGREVILHAYGETKKYLPKKPKPKASPPYKEPRRIFEIRETENTRRSVEVRKPNGVDMHTWCQQHADKNGVTVIVTDHKQHYRLQEFLPIAPVTVNSETEAMAYIKKNGGKIETEGGTPGNYRVYISDRHGRSLYMFKHHNRVKTHVYKPE